MATKKRITKKLLFAKTVEILQPKLGLDDWKITVKYSRQMKTAVADCAASPEYKQATIRLSLLRAKDYPHYEIVQTAVHEMMHCILWPLTQWTYELCKKDKHKIEMTRRMDESIITHLEKTYTEVVFSSLQEELNSQGYHDIDMVFENIRVVNDKRPATKKATKKKK